jgi:uncharacterized protein (TIGR02001 family)
MKKTILTVALVAALGSSAFAQNATPAPAAPAPAAPSNPLGDLTVQATLDYESQYVFRGKKVTNQAFQPSAQFGYPVYGGSIYTGVWTNQPIGHAGGGSPPSAPGPNQHNEIDLYGGYTYPLDMLTKGLTVDVGYMYYWYPDVSGLNITSDNQEVHLGFTYDTSSVLNGININPTFYYYYDFVLDQNTLEINLSYTWDMSSMVGVKGISLVPSVTVGWLHANNSLGQVALPAPPANIGQHWRNSYMYYAFHLELDYKINDWATAFIGVRYAGNNDGNGAIPGGGTSQSPGSANNIWGGAGLKFGM